MSRLVTEISEQHFWNDFFTVVYKLVKLRCGHAHFQFDHVHTEEGENNHSH